MEKEKCEICDKIVNDDSVLVSQERFEEIGYKIPISHIKGETEMVDISKVKGKPFVRVGGSPCHCDKKINIALKRIKK
mgnify:CR=1 FL=1